jgi:hypothetical protein
MSDARTLAHELVDNLPESQLRGLVEFLRTIVDPAAEALKTAPLDDEEQTQDEAQAWMKPVAGSTSMAAKAFLMTRRCSA